MGWICSVGRPIEPASVIELHRDAFGIQVLPQIRMLLNDDAIMVAAVALAADFDVPLADVLAEVGVWIELERLFAEKAPIDDQFVGWAR